MLEGLSVVLYFLFQPSDRELGLLCCHFMGLVPGLDGGTQTLDQELEHLNIQVWVNGEGVECGLRGDWVDGCIGLA
jgi:hypothetical protein